MSAFAEIREACFGGSGMPPPLTHRSRRRLAWVSLAPGVVLAAAVIHAAISLSYSDLALYGFPGGGGSTVLGSFGFFPDQAPTFWRRLFAVTEALQTLAPLALALLFAAGLQRWSRAEGSWMRVIGVSLAGIALAAGAFAAGGYVVLGEVVLVHVRDDLWTGDHIEISKFKAVGRLGEELYCRIGDTFEMKRASKI